MVENTRGASGFFSVIWTLALCACSGATPGPLAVTERRQAAAEYVIGPGDMLNVFVYRAPELSAPELTVRPDGRMSLPLVSDLEATGKTPTALAREIEQRLRPYVLEPNVTVMIRSFRGPPNRQIRVIGEVAQPMAIPFREGMTVLDVMIETKGLTRYAAGNRAEIVRRGPDGEPLETVRVRLADLLRGGDIRQDVALRAGDTLVVPSGWF